MYGEARHREDAQELEGEGLQWRDTPRELAEAAEVVLSSLPDDDVLEQVASGPDGVLAGLSDGQVWIDLSTVSPRKSRDVAQRVREQGATFLDAPVSGSVPQVQSGTLTIMVGGDEDAYTRVEPILRELGTPHYIGENGHGLVLKLAINISLAVQMLAFSEGLLLADRAGVDRKRAVEVMTREPDRLADAEGARRARARPPGRRLVRRRPDAEGHRARPRRRAAAERAAPGRSDRRRGAHVRAGGRLRASRSRLAVRGAGQADPAPLMRSRWLILALVVLAQLMVVLDATIVNIALPSAQADLGFSNGSRQWIVTGYALAFGSLLPLGGRLGDVFGRRRTLVLGSLGFAGASALGGAAQSFEWLLAARVLQGAFGALLAPSALALLTITFTEPRDRNKAFGIFGAVIGSGAAVGLLLGGALTEYLSWRWCLYVNLFLALPVTVGALMLVPAQRCRASPASTCRALRRPPAACS